MPRIEAAAAAAVISLGQSVAAVAVNGRVDLSIPQCRHSSDNSCHVSNLDFTEATDSEWQWHQLGHMQVFG